MAASSTTRRTADLPAPRRRPGSPNARTSIWPRDGRRFRAPRSSGHSIWRNTENFDYVSNYVDDLESVIDLDVIRSSGLKIGADPLGGASVDYWAAIAEDYDLNLDVVHPDVDPTWSFMTLDWDENIRMDCSSPYAMAGLIASRNDFDIATGNDADADRHGIVTPDAG
jgi:phosphoglucomutase